jgi:hypothetical protein
MMRRGLIAVFFLVCFIAVLTLVALGLSGPSTASTVIATSKTAALHCVSHEPATLRALKQDGKRVVVVVKSFQPANPPSARLVVSLLTANKTRRHEVTRFAVHPLRAFSAQEPNRQQRFLVSLAEQAQLIEDGQPLCVEVGFDTSGAKLEGGVAEIEIELVNMTGAPGK